MLFERRIVAAIAGEIAQRRFAPNSVDAMHGAGDRRVIQTPTSTSSTAQRRRFVRRGGGLLELRTEELVARNWPSIERIPARLLSQTVLSGEKVEEAFKDPLLAEWVVPPGVSPADSSPCPYYCSRRRSPRLVLLIVSLPPSTSSTASTCSAMVATASGSSARCSVSWSSQPTAITRSARNCPRAQASNAAGEASGLTTTAGACGHCHGIAADIRDE